ncbi:MAG: hypothetical protein FJX75_16865 [Armatimonadetes bacterium]|nr:hypothetical protein [Armatimonadota bacterium]
MRHCRGADLPHEAAEHPQHCEATMDGFLTSANTWAGAVIGLVVGSASVVGLLWGPVVRAKDATIETLREQTAWYKERVELAEDHAQRQADARVAEVQGTAERHLIRLDSQSRALGNAYARLGALVFTYAGAIADHQERGAFIDEARATFRALSEELAWTPEGADGSLADTSGNEHACPG